MPDFRDTYQIIFWLASLALIIYMYKIFSFFTCFHIYVDGKIKKNKPPFLDFGLRPH